MRHLTLRVDEDLWERLALLAGLEASRLAEDQRVPRVGNRSATARWVLELGLKVAEEKTDGRHA